MPLCTLCKRESAGFSGDPYQGSLEYDGEDCSRCGVSWDGEARVLADEKYLL